MKEEWKPIKDFEESHKISNFGKVMSLARKWKPTTTYLKPLIGKKGYLRVQLRKIGKLRTRTIHTIVWDAFGDRPRNGLKLQVDHIDDNKQNNRIDNLQLLTNRQNVSKGLKNKKMSSKYTGVYWRKDIKKWCSKIDINGKTKANGVFIKEHDAHLAYQKALKELL